MIDCAVAGKPLIDMKDDDDRLFASSLTIGISISGGTGWDSLISGEGNDAISAGDGSDFVIPGLGGDVTDGGDGIDTLSFSLHASGVTVDLSTTNNDDGDPGDRAVNFENVWGTSWETSGDHLTGSDGPNELQGFSGNDVLLGLGGDDLLLGGEGQDTITGADGTDTVSYDDFAFGVVFEFGPNATADGDVVSGVENFVGSRHNDFVTGDSSDRTIDVGDGNDFILGGSGSETLIGADGRDDIRAGVGADEVLAEDGLPDSIDCGDGTDVAIIDQSDPEPSNCETVIRDGDYDGIDANVDNCPGVKNNDQTDTDFDALGDACDGDDDNDGIADDDDSCDVLAGPGPSACPAVSRSLTLSYGRGQFTGVLMSAPATEQCTRDVFVKIFMDVPGPYKFVGMGATDADGAFQVPRSRRRGVYYAEVRETTVKDVATCSAASAYKRLR